MKIIHPNSQVLDIVRLYLETRESLSEIERKTILTIISAASTPIWEFSSKAVVDRVRKSLQRARARAGR